MFLFVLRKIASNRWKVLCLLAGSILVVAMLSSIPIYTNGTLQRLLVKEMEQYQVDTGFYPGYYVVDAQLKFSGSDTRMNYFNRVGDIAVRTPSDYVNAPAATYGRILEMGSISRIVEGADGKTSRQGLSVKLQRPGSGQPQGGVPGSAELDVPGGEVPVQIHRRIRLQEQAAHSCGPDLAAEEVVGGEDAQGGVGVSQLARHGEGRLRQGQCARVGAKPGAGEVLALSGRLTQQVEGHAAVPSAYRPRPVHGHHTPLRHRHDLRRDQLADRAVLDARHSLWPDADALEARQ